MGSSSLKTALLILLVAVALPQSLSNGNVTPAESLKVIDPFLAARARSSVGQSDRTVMMMLTAQRALTESHRMILGSFGHVTGSIGRVAAVEVPAANVESVLALDFLSGAYSPRRFHPTLDASAREIGATFVWDNIQDQNGKSVDGSRILIGILDTGVDLTHPDLRFANGTSKVLYLWDQTVSGKPPQGFRYGSECSWGEISNGQCPEKDIFGHGTHVASIAASSGLAIGNYRGIAPGAVLLVVKSGRSICGGGSWTFDENTIVDGLAYLAQKARELGMPLVVNLSLGGNIGGHDDASPLELAIDDLNSQGVVVTVSAGNEADNRGHAMGYLATSAQTSVKWEINGQATSAALDFWYPIEGTISATVVTPSGEEVQGPTPDDGTQTSDGLITVVPGRTPKAKQWAVTVQNPDGLKASWSVIVGGVESAVPVRWDAYVDSDSCAYPPAAFLTATGYTVNATGTVSVPATAAGAIAVGAHVSKNAWLNKLHDLVYLSNFDVGQIAPFSSRGPTRDGRIKPDISAPGVFITAARSLDVPSSDSDPDEHHRVLAGTSMAAPQVAGVIALMLQYDQQLTAQEIRSTLVDGAYLDEFTGFIGESKGSDAWGWGKVDARTATRFFRVTSALLSLPPEDFLALNVDGALQGQLRGGEVLTLRFLSGSSHTFEIRPRTFTANDTRYVVRESRAVFSTNGAFTPTVRIQYLLSLESSIGEVQGQGWYDAGSRADFAVNPPVASTRLGGPVGVSLVLDHWIDVQGNKVSSGWLVMDSPHSLRAVWIARPVDSRPVLIVGGLVVVVLLIFLRRRRQGRANDRLGGREAPVSI